MTPISGHYSRSTINKQYVNRVKRVFTIQIGIRKKGLSGLVQQQEHSSLGAFFYLMLQHCMEDYIPVPVSCV
jgi:hypothetical protein